MIFFVWIIALVALANIINTKYSTTTEYIIAGVITLPILFIEPIIRFIIKKGANFQQSNVRKEEEEAYEEILKRSLNGSNIKGESDFILCPNCGEKNIKAADFCKACGKDLRKL